MSLTPTGVNEIDHLNIRKYNGLKTDLLST